MRLDTSHLSALGPSLVRGQATCSADAHSGGMVAVPRWPAEALRRGDVG